MLRFRLVACLLFVAAAARQCRLETPDDTVLGDYFRQLIDKAVEQKLQTLTDSVRQVQEEANQQIELLTEALLQVKQEVDELKQQVIPIAEEVEAQRQVEGTGGEKNETQHVEQNIEPTHEVLLAIGGFNGSDWVSSVDLFDPLTPGWRSVAHMPTGRRYRFAAAVLHNKVYVCGGLHPEHSKSCISYDPLSNFWNTSISDMLELHRQFPLAAHDGALYAVGGWYSPKTVECYNPSTNTWTKKADFPVTVLQHAMASLDGSLYLVGGSNYYDSRVTYSTLYRYEQLIDSWTRLPDMPSPRTRLDLVAVPSSVSGSNDNYLYVIGGRDGFYSFPDTVSRFNMATNSWVTPKNRTSGSRKLFVTESYPNAALLGSDIYAVSNSRVLTLNISQIVSVNASSSSSPSWKVSDYMMSTPRWGHALVKVRIPQN